MVSHFLKIQHLLAKTVLTPASQSTRSFPKLKTKAFGLVCGLQTNSHLRMRSTDSKNDIKALPSIVQIGLDIVELPILVRKVNTVNEMMEMKDQFEDAEFEIPGVNEETAAIRNALDRCTTTKEIYKLLECLPSEEVTPSVAAFALYCIFSLNNNFEQRNESQSSWNHQKDEDESSTFLFNAVLHRLCDRMCETKDIPTLLLGLRVLSHDITESSHQRGLVRKVLKECINRLADNQFDLIRICEFVEVLSQFGIGKQYMQRISDSVWPYIVDQSHKIDLNSLTKLYNILPQLKSSQLVVFKTLEQRTYALWWQIRMKDVLQIFKSISLINQNSNQLLGSLTKFLNAHFYKFHVTEENLSKIVEVLIHLKYTDGHIEKVLDKCFRYYSLTGYVKNVKFLKDVSEFCETFQLRSKNILEGIASQMNKCSDQLSPVQVHRIVKMFAILNYTPLNNFGFYCTLESAFSNKFLRFRPQDLIEVLLCCATLQIYALDFVDFVFDKPFLDRLYSIQNANEVKVALKNLKLLDMALTLECKEYKGPKLALNPKEQKQPVKTDGRIVKMLEYMKDDLSNALNGKDSFRFSVPVENAPAHPFYVVDILIHLNSFKSPLSMEKTEGIAHKVALVIHLPEHYCRYSKILIGPQAMRLRHLNRLGYIPIGLDYAELKSSSALICKHKIWDMIETAVQ